MKESIFTALIVLLFWLVLPLLAAGGRAPQTGPEGAAEPIQALPREETGSTNVGAEEETETAGAIPTAQAFDSRFRLPVLREGQTQSMDLECYLAGALLGEMPLRFGDEALKAQVVACRTYALRSYSHRRHEGAAVCTDAGCCMAWRDPAEASPEDRAKALEAVRATDGLVLCYDGALIDATFFSCSGGRTEDAAAVWGSELPYLQAVDSPGEEEAAHYSDELRLSLAEFRRILEEADGSVVLTGDPGTWVGQVRYTAGGGVDEMELGGVPFRGTELRKRFGLRSTAFSLELTGEEAVFTTRGYGHRVGMSQYGAKAMAEAGSDFEEILRWYYRGVELRQAEIDGYQ